MSTVLADTGALVALLDRREKFHAWAVEQIQAMSPPLVTCEAVLAELCYLLSGVPRGTAAVRSNLESGAWTIDFSLSAEQERVFELMKTYSNLSMSLADGCLVRMSELRADSRILTLDRHFRTYRRNRRQVIPLITPPEP
ncbi:MAG TPA: PIN domain-containing protein [Opitutaceae bacterium]